jgi:uncharacterized membrane protein
MNSKFSILIVLFLLLASQAIAQEKTKKQIKEEKKIALQKEVDQLVNSKEFIFLAETAFPSGMRSVNLSVNSNYLKYHPTHIESYMPYYGRVYSAAPYSSDNGLKFEGEPTEYKVTTGKKKYLVTTDVKGATDNYTLNLTVSFDGSASLSIISNNRSTISYGGQIYPPPTQEEKK